jgi:hypothetical protein
MVNINIELNRNQNFNSGLLYLLQRCRYNRKNKFKKGLYNSGAQKILLLIQVNFFLLTFI